VTWDRSGLQSVVVLFISMVAGIIIFIGIIGGMVRSSLASSAASTVDCIVGCVSWGWEAMTGGSPIDVFAVGSEFAVIGIFIDIVGGFIWGSSLTSSMRSVVNCVSDGARRVEAMAGRLRVIVFPVVSVCRVVGNVVFIIGIIVIGCVVWNVFCLATTG